MEIGPLRVVLVPIDDDGRQDPHRSEADVVGHTAVISASSAPIRNTWDRGGANRHVPLDSLPEAPQCQHVEQVHSPTSACMGKPLPFKCSIYVLRLSFKRKID